MRKKGSRARFSFGAKVSRFVALFITMSLMMGIAVFGYDGANSAVSTYGDNAESRWGHAEASNFQELANEILQARGTSLTIWITDSIDFTRALIIPADTTIRLYGWRGDFLSGDLDAPNPFPAFDVRGTLELAGELTLTGFNAGAVHVNGGFFSLDGGIITYNGSTLGGAVRVTNAGTFVMNDGWIYDNWNVGFGSLASGGGVSLVNNSIFTMHGGRIFHNHTSGSGGGVSIATGSSFTMTGGSIGYNKAERSGGAIGFGSQSPFEAMQGLYISSSAVLTGNEAPLLPSAYGYWWQSQFASTIRPSVSSIGTHPFNNADIQITRPPNVLGNRPCDQTNLARSTTGAVMTASSSANLRHATNANNGNISTVTRETWSARYSNEQYLQVNFGEIRNFNHIRIYQNGNRIRNYRLEYSNDGDKWTALSSGTQLPQWYPASYNYVHPTTINAQFVRLVSGYSNNPNIPIVIIEFEVYYMPN